MVVHQRAIVAVLAGGLGRRLGGAKPSIGLGGRALVLHPLRAAADADLQAIVVAKPSSELPALGVQVLYEPQEPSHPLCGVVAALSFAAGRGCPAVLTVGCDMPFLTGPLLAWLADLDGPVMANVDGRAQPLLARVPVEGLPLLEGALAEGLSLTAALCGLSPSIVAEDELGRFGDPRRLCFNVNDQADLRTAAAWLTPGGR